MIADRLLAWLNRRAAYAPTRWSVLRIAVFTVVALVIAGQIVPGRPGEIRTAPYNKARATQFARNVALPLGDPRGFAPTHRPGAFQVAWVGGSEVLGVGKGTQSFIPQLVGQEVGQVDGKPVSTDIYFLNAIRLADELSALDAAVTTKPKPDLVVVSLNPVWVLNDLAVQQWDYLDGLLARGSIWPPPSWRVGASLLSPGDVGWRGLSTLTTAVNDRFHWGIDLNDRTDGISFLHASESKEPSAPTGLGKLAQTRPVDFFFSHFHASSHGTGVAARQLAILERQVKSRSGLNRAILQEMFDVVRRAGVDAYFYLAPIDPRVYDNPLARQSLDTIRGMLAGTTDGRTSSRVWFDPRGLQDRVPRTPYEDIVHVLDGAPEAHVLAGDICALLERRGRTGCEGR